MFSRERVTIGRFWIFLSKSGAWWPPAECPVVQKKYLYELGSKKIYHSAPFLFMNAQYFTYDWCIEKVFTISTTPCTQKYPKEQPAEYVNIDNHVKLVGDTDELLQDVRRLWRIAGLVLMLKRYKTSEPCVTWPDYVTTFELCTSHNRQPFVLKYANGKIINLPDKCHTCICSSHDKQFLDHFCLLKYLYWNRKQRSLVGNPLCHINSRKMCRTTFLDKEECAQTQA